jgi:hypothetical protein
MLSLSRIRLATAIAMILVVPTCLFGQSVKPELIDWPVWRVDSGLASVVANARLALWRPAIPIAVGKDLAPEERDSCERTTRNGGPRKGWLRTWWDID